MIDRKVPDFFDKSMVVLAFIGLVVFFTFALLAIASYSGDWNPIDNSFSSAGRIIDGNKGAGFLSTALACGGTLLAIVNLVFIRAIRDNWKTVKQPTLATGFILVIIARVLMILTGAFPAGAWGDEHNYIATGWALFELFGLIIIAAAILSKKKGGPRKDKAWGIVSFILIGFAIPFWIPYAMGIYDISIPEIVTASVMLGYSAALWVRAWKGHVLLGKARTT